MLQLEVLQLEVIKLGGLLVIERSESHIWDSKKNTIYIRNYILDVLYTPLQAKLTLQKKETLETKLKRKCLPIKYLKKTSEVLQLINT